MEQLPGFKKGENIVWILDHTIYGMIQGACNWKHKLDGSYEALGYIQSRADPCIRFWERNGEWTITETYTNDVIGLSSSDEEEQKIQKELGEIYEIKQIEDQGEGRVILGM